MDERRDSLTSGGSMVLVPGDLLVSTVTARDYFQGTVILLLDSDENGDMGVVLNRYSPMALEMALPDWSLAVSAPELLFEGGPCEQDSAICLAELPVGMDEPIGWTRLFGDLGAVDMALPVDLVIGCYDKIRVFAGYAGWGKSQLQAEITRGDWIVTTATAADVFACQPERLWRETLRRIPGEASFFSAWTPTPTFN